MNAGDELADLQESIEERREQFVSVGHVARLRGGLHPDQVREFESLILARKDLDRQLYRTWNAHRRLQLNDAIKEIDRRVASLIGPTAPDPVNTKNIPGLLLQAVIIPTIETAEGQLIASVALPWFDVVALIQKDPSAIWQIDPFKWEEIIAGAYTRAGFDVILTPRSNDKGRDVIASTRGVGCVRFFDQVKAYGPGRVVPANDVRAMIGVLDLEKNVSKGIVTTTSDFAPGIYKDENIRRFMPHRLELRPRVELTKWLASLAANKPT